MRKAWRDREQPIEHRRAFATEELRAARDLMAMEPWTDLVAWGAEEIDRVKDELAQVRRDEHTSDDVRRGIILGIELVLNRPQAIVGDAIVFIDDHSE